ncbi:MAG: restriction endonuclease subunit S [Gammaproteobacteria bacterium]|nr:restriction endonuclease subunit S [Gammaproteobacteria bacterium]
MLFPSGWTLATIDDLVEDGGVFIDGDWVESKDQDPEGDVRLIQLADIGDGEYRDKSERFLTHAKAVELGCTFLKKGDVLIARMPDPLGRACIFPGDAKSAVTVVDVAIVRSAAGEFDHRWLMYFVNAPAFRSAVASMQSGSTRKRISRGNLAKIALPVPPLDEQKRIVAEIEKQFSRLDEAVANLKRVKANLKRYKAAVLKAAVEGRLVVDGATLVISKWDRKPIGVAIESLDQGWSPQCESESTQRDDDWAVIKTTAVQPLQYLEAENKRLPDQLKPRVHLELVPGDLLITRAGPRSRVGVACLVKTTRPRIMLCDKVYRLRTKQNVALPAFLELVLNSPEVVDALNELKTGISDSGVNLTQRRFKELLVPIPSIKEQEHTLAEVELRLSIVREVESQVDTNSLRAYRLRQSILKASFSGEMTGAI